MTQLSDEQDNWVADTWRAVVVLAGPDERDPSVPVTYWDNEEEAKAHLRRVTSSRGANAEGYVTPCYYRTEISERRRVWAW